MAEAHTFYLEILTPERPFYGGLAQGLILPSLDGQLGVEPGHEPAVTAMEPGELRYKMNDHWEVAAVGSGFAEIKQEYVIVLTSFAERPEEIDRMEEERARKRAQEALRQSHSQAEFRANQIMLARAMARLRNSRNPVNLD